MQIMLHSHFYITVYTFMSRSLFKSVSLVSSMTFISRLLGFARDLLAAQIFGVNAAVDAFYIAFKIPNFMRNLFAEGSFSQAFVPVLSEYHTTKSADEVRVFIRHMSYSLGLALLLITILGIVFAPYVIEFFAPGLDPYRYHLATYMLRITFPYLMLISLTAFAGSILNTYGRFGLPAFTPALLNISLIATALCMTQFFTVPVISQAWGVLIAGFVQLFFQLAGLYRIGFLVKPVFNWNDSGVRRVLKLIVPAVFGASMGQLSILLNTILASFLITGSVSWLYYSERLAYFPLGIFGVALAVVILPHLSRQHAKASVDGFSASLCWGLRWNIIIGAPASITMLMLSGPLIISLFDYGKFTVNDVLMTQKSVITYGIGLQAFMLAKILSSAFYAKQDLRTPVKIAFYSLTLNMLFSLIFIWPLAHAGLALSSSLSSWVNVITLWIVLYRRGIFTTMEHWGRFALRILGANGVLAVYLHVMSDPLSQWLHWHWPQRLAHIVFLGLSAVLVYAFCLWVSGTFKQAKVSTR